MICSLDLYYLLGIRVEPSIALLKFRFCGSHYSYPFPLKPGFQWFLFTFLLVVSSKSPYLGILLILCQNLVLSALFYILFLFSFHVLLFVMTLFSSDWSFALKYVLFNSAQYKATKALPDIRLLLTI